VFHGVKPCAQLLSVPIGALFDWSGGCVPVRGPENATGVAPVIRRLKSESTRRHFPRTSATSTTDTPWPASALSTFSLVMVTLPSG
jgi:hypothetical protein